LTSTPPTTTYPLSLHDALPICDVDREPAGALQWFVVGVDAAGDEVHQREAGDVDGEEHEPECHLVAGRPRPAGQFRPPRGQPLRDRKSTRLNSSHRTISYAVFC